MALRHRRRVMSLFGRRSIPQDGQLDANKTSKDLDLEKGSPLKGAPTSVSIFTFLIHSWSPFTY